MPPAFIDEDEYESASDDLDMIPAKKPKAGKPAKKTKEVEPEPESEEEEVAAEDEDEEVDDAPANAVEDDEAEVDDGESEENEEVYAVERVLKHGFLDSGVLTYQVKWVGYDDEHNTWEPEENLIEGAKEALELYHKKIGGRPERETKSSAKKGRAKRKLDSEAEPSPAPSAGKRGKRAKVEGKANGSSQQVLPAGNWEDEVRAIEVIEDSPSQKSGTQSSMKVFLSFNDGHKTAVAMSTVRQRCPQKLLDYYEQHLTFRESGEMVADLN